MIDRTTKLRWRRRYRQRKRQVEDLSVQTEEQLERHFFRRLNNLIEVRRFVLSWLLLITFLIAGSIVQIRGLSPYYQKLAPAPGGNFTEGILGTFTNANPLYASGPVDSAVSKLVFASLFTYDEKNQLKGDLAQKLTSDDRGIKYTIELKPNLHWHDGRPLTAEDVIFTYQTIQNPDARSPLFRSWQGIKMESPNDKTIIFTLPNVLSAFPFGLTNGIVPKHLLSQVPISQLRSARFNTVNPVGAGPFKWGRVEVTGQTPESREEQIGLLPNEGYHGEKAKLAQFLVRSFKDEKRMLASFERGELNAMAGLLAVPDTLSKKADTREYNIPLTGEVMAFFKTTHPNLSEVAVRQALVHAVNVPAIVKGLGYPAIIARSPLLEGMIGYDKTLTQLPFNAEQANKLLDQAGWVKDKDGFRAKAGRPLAVKLYSESTSDYKYVSQELQKAWQAIGVKVEVLLQNENDLQTAVANHEYDILLYGISVGADPDVFAYWHSSQADPKSSSRLNLSEYKSTAADKALESGRTRSDPTIRAIKYRPFLEAWRADAPAMALYQPRFVYVTHGPLFNFEPEALNGSIDRFNNVSNWMIRQTMANK